MIHGLKSLQQLLPAFRAQFERLRMVGRFGRGFGGCLTDQIYRALQARIHAGQLRVCGDGLAEEGGLVGRQLAQQESCQAGLESVARVCGIFSH